MSPPRVHVKQLQGRGSTPEIHILCQRVTRTSWSIKIKGSRTAKPGLHRNGSQVPDPFKSSFQGVFPSYQHGIYTTAIMSRCRKQNVISPAMRNWYLEPPLIQRKRMTISLGAEAPRLLPLLLWRVDHTELWFNRTSFSSCKRICPSGTVTW